MPKFKSHNKIRSLPKNLKYRKRKMPGFEHRDLRRKRFSRRPPQPVSVPRMSIYFRGLFVAKKDAGGGATHANKNASNEARSLKRGSVEARLAKEAALLKQTRSDSFRASNELWKERGSTGRAFDYCSKRP